MNTIIAKNYDIIKAMEALKPLPPGVLINKATNLPVPAAPEAGPFAETAAMVRKAVREGRMTAEEGLKLSNRAYMDSMHAQLLGLPVETGSIQLPGTGNSD